VALRCLIVDDSERFLDVARSSLDRDGIEVVGTATTSATALEQAGKLRPDVVLVDLGLGSESGVDLARQLVEDYPYLASRVVLVSTQAEEDVADLIRASAAVGFISKRALSPTTVRRLVEKDG
jgi:two-component system, NarL family, nitrate/nitrite response regulator NarL